VGGGEGNLVEVLAEGEPPEGKGTRRATDQDQNGESDRWQMRAKVSFSLAPTLLYLLAQAATQGMAAPDL